MHIDSYSFGLITIDGKSYSSDVIVFPDKVVSNWWRVEGHSLCEEDLKSVFEYKPNVLVVGKGAQGVMRIPDNTRSIISEKGIDLIDACTDKACNILNKLLEDGEKAVGAFHLTC